MWTDPGFCSWRRGFELTCWERAPWPQQHRRQNLNRIQARAHCFSTSDTLPERRIQSSNSVCFSTILCDNFHWTFNCQKGFTPARTFILCKDRSYQRYLESTLFVQRHQNSKNFSSKPNDLMKSNLVLLFKHLHQEIDLIKSLEKSFDRLVLILYEEFYVREKEVWPPLESYGLTGASRQTWWH